MKNFDEFYNFMLEYTEFFEQTAVLEREKMCALLSDDLRRIEKCLNEHQSTIKKAEAYENEREKLQARIGLGGKSFRQIMALTDGDEYEALRKLYNRFKTAVDNVSHSNKTSLQIAETNMKIIESMTATVNDAKCYDSKGAQTSKRRNMGFLNTKI